MKHFINVIFDKVEEVDDIVVSEVATSASNALLESETNYLLEEHNSKTVLTVETHVQLDEQQSDDVANDIANKLFDMGYDNFDIEVSV